MEIYKELTGVPSFNDSIVTIGTFDGCHRGHQDVIKKVVYNAKMSSSKSVLITFNPHPRHILNKNNKLPILMHIDKKLEFLHSFNVLAEEINFKFSVQFGKMNETKKEVLKELFNQQVFQNCDSFWHTLHVNDIEEGRKFYKENTNSTTQIVDQVYSNEIFHIDKYTEKDWWATYPWQLKFSCLNLAIEDTSIPTITEHLLKSLMLGQPVVWIAHPKLLDYLNELGFTTYAWMKYDFDYIVDKSKRIESAIKEVKRQVLNPEFILYTRKHTYWTNKKNKENFNRLAREDICLDKFLEKIN